MTNSNPSTSVLEQAELAERATPAPESASGLKPIWEMFDEVATRFADRTAISFAGREVSYRELHAEASELSLRLRTLGVGPESLVGVYLERSPRAIVALLGILKAGGAYLPLDPAYPSERVQTILEDARPTVLLTEEKLLEKLPAHTAHAICLDVASATNSCVEETSPDRSIASTLENLAYVIYTSGSTGKPKGVMVTQANAARLLSATADWFHFDEHDVWTLFHSLAFDFSVWEVWGCLLFGGRLVIVPFAVSRSPEDFYELLVKERVTVLNQTPSAFYQLIAIDQQRRSPDLALRVVVFGGEALNFSTLRPWFALHGDTRPRLINMYGITETTVHVTYREVTAADAEGGTPSLIGVPIPDMQLHLLNESLEPVSDGEVGEICVGGAGVARGYLNRPELNAQRFIPNPFSGMAGAKLYRSGDLARRLPDGEVEYLGRGDGQVKIQGFRIELGEVEAAVVGHPGLREARVTAHTDAAGTKRLVAYFVVRDGVVLTAGALSEFLSGKLPPWMMPSVYLAIDAFPLTPHGKVDYAALPTPAVGSTGSDVAPGGGIDGSGLELEVAEIWRKVLGADRVGLDDNFFDIGGTSLLLVAVHSKLQTLLGRKISIADLFGYTTVRKLAGKLSSTSASSEEGLATSPTETGARQDQTQVETQDRAQKQRAAFARAREARRVP